MPKIKIMIVEDELIIAMNLKAGLSIIGYEICKSVTTGEDAVKHSETEKPDIVLIDITLKGEMDGIEAAREIRSRHDIPIIFMTGYDDVMTRRLAEETKPVAYLTKPVEIEELRFIIDKALQRQKKDSE